MSLTEQKQLEQEFVMPTFGRKQVEFVSGRGMTLVDDAGQEYLDFLAGIGVISLGHCHPKFVAALTHQAQTLVHVGNYYYIEGRGQLAQKLSVLLEGTAEQGGEGVEGSKGSKGSVGVNSSASAVPEAQPSGAAENAGIRDTEGVTWKTFFANSGAEANECAIKIARLHARKAAEAAGKSADAAPRTIVTLKKSFHGRTLATLAATAQPAKQEAFQPLPDGFVAVEANNCEELQALFDAQGDSICAVFMECVQGESGVHPLTPEFAQLARALTEKHDALLMCDEVQCGLFRTGLAFGYQNLGIMPDVVTMAKGIASGIPMGACAARGEIGNTFDPGDHGSTFGGSNLAITAANTTLDVIAEENIAQNVLEVGQYMRSELAKLPHVSEVRGLGLMLAAELAGTAKTAPEIVSDALEAGLVLNATGPTTLRFLPPLVCTKADVDTLVDRLTKLL
jgi:acetylornithine aminotransferase